MQIQLFLALLIIVLPFQVIPASYTIDSSLSSSNSPDFRTLADAVPYLTDSQNSISENITIIFKNNTVGIDQTLPDFVVSSGTGGIDMIFENTPTQISSVSDCNLLPSILLSQVSGNSQLNVGNISHLTITGMTLKIVADSTANYLYNIGTVTFYNVCMDTSDPASMNSSLQLLNFTAINNLTITNFVMIHNSKGGMNIASTNTIIQSWQLLLDYIMQQPIFYFQTSSIPVGISITNVSATCNDWIERVSTSLVYIEDKSANVNITNVEVSNCSLLSSYYANNVKFVFLHVYDTMTSVMQQINFANITMNLTYGSISGIIEFRNILIFNLSDILFQNITILSLDSVASTTATYGMNFITATWVFGVTSSSAIFQNITLANCQIMGAGTFMYVESLDDITPLINTFFDNITMINTTISFGAGFEIHPQRYISRVNISSVLFYNVRNFQVINCTLNDTIILSIVTQDPDPTIYVLDMFGLELENFTLIGNTFSSVGQFDPIEMLGAQLSIDNMLAINNTIIGCDFMTIDLRVSTFILTNSFIEGLYLTSSSSFIGYKLSEDSYFNPEPAYFQPNQQLIAETRPLSIINVTFSKVILDSSSCLVYSSNPMIVFANNVFSNINSSESTLIEIGAYTPPTKKPAGYSYVNSSSVEDTILINSPYVLSAFRSMRDLISSLNPDNEISVFFVGFQNNSFLNVTSNNEESLILLGDMTLDTESLGFFNTSLSNVQIVTSRDFNMFSFSQLNQVYLNGMILSNVLGTGSIVGISSTSIYKFILSDFSLSAITGIAALNIISSICGDMAITNSSSNQIVLHGPWIVINCYSETSQILFDSNSFSDVNVTAVSYELSPINFILLQIQEAASNTVPAVYFTDSNFTGITLNKSDQGFGQDAFSSQMISIALSDSIIIFERNRFEKLTNIPSDNVLVVSALNITFTDCLFKNIVHYELSGAIYLVFNYLEIDQTLFQENSGQNSFGGGLLHLINPSTTGDTPINVVIKNSTFVRNSAVTASILQVESTLLNLSLIDSVFIDNCALTTGIIYLYQLQESYLAIENITIELIYLYEDSIGDYIYTFIELLQPQAFVNIEMNNFDLRVGGVFSGDLVSANQSTNTNLVITNFTYSSDVDLQMIAGLNFTNDTNYVISQGELSFGVLNANRINASLSNISIQQINVAEKALFTLECLNSQGDVYVGTLNIINSTFKSIINAESLITLNPQNLQPDDICQAYISISNSSFTNITAPSVVGAIFHSNIYQLGNSSNLNGSAMPQYTAVSITNSSFSQISAGSAGIYYAQRVYHNTAVIFIDNTFQNISVKDNGGIFYIAAADQQLQASTSSSSSRRMLATAATDYSRSENYILSGNLFNNVSAENGGIFYSATPNGENSTITLQKNSFSDISVQERGSILYLNNHTVFSVDSQFISSYAGISGAIIYSLDAQYTSQSDSISQNVSESLQPISYGPNYLDVQLITSIPIEINYFNSTSSNYSFLVNNISSYSLQSISVVTTLKYQNGNISQKVIDTSDSVSSVKFTFEGAFFGSKKALGQYCIESVCYLNQSGLILVGLAESIINVTVAYTSVNPSTNTNYNGSTMFQIQLRACIPGEINKTISGDCEYCASGSYSLSPYDSSCLSCPGGGQCMGGSDIVLNPGYWRNSTTTASIFACNDSSGSRCLGGYEASCSEGLAGPVCVQCDTDQGYLPTGKAQCSKCAPANQVLPTAIVALLGLTAYQVFVIYTTLKDNTNVYKDSLESTEIPPLRAGSYIILLTTYSQISSVISKLQIGYMAQILGVCNTLGNPSQQASFSAQCAYYINSPDPFLTFKFKMVLFVLSPLVKLFVVVIFQLIRALVKRKEEDKKKNAIIRIGVTTVVLIMLEQPGIIGAICDYLSCSTLYPTDITKYVSAIPNISCDTVSYKSFRDSFVVPSLIIWGFAIPLTLFIFLKKNKAKLESSEMMRKIFGSLYSNYTNKAFYWGLVIMLFKIIMFVLDSVIDLPQAARDMIFLLFIHLYNQIYKYQSPYMHDELIKIERYMIGTFKWTLMFVMFKDALNIADSSLSGEIFNLLILIANVLFIGYVLIKLSAEYLKKIADLFRKIKLWYINKKQKKKDLNLETTTQTTSELTHSTIQRASIYKSQTKSSSE